MALVFIIMPRRKMFVSCNGPKKNRVGRSEKYYFFLVIFLF